MVGRAQTAVKRTTPDDTRGAHLGKNRNLWSRPLGEGRATPPDDRPKPAVPLTMFFQVNIRTGGDPLGRNSFQADRTEAFRFGQDFAAGFFTDLVHFDHLPGQNRFQIKSAKPVDKC